MCQVFHVIQRKIKYIQKYLKFLLIKVDIELITDMYIEVFIYVIVVSLMRVSNHEND